MSRSNNTEFPNPAQRFYQWRGDGGFRYWDKTTESNVDVPLPFSFMVLDTLSTIKGFNDSEQSGYWSNEVRDIKKEILTVKTKSGTCAKGLYEQVITDRACSGARYCQSVYIAIKEDGKLVIANIQMMGAALGAWIEFRKKNKIFDGIISVNTCIEGKKGKTVYQIPVFEKLEAMPELDEEARNLDIILQDYLKIYFSKTGQEIADKHVEEKIDTTPIPDLEPVNTKPEDFTF